MFITKELWRDLCKQAAVEKDPDKLVRICDEINAILQQADESAKQNHLNNSKAAAGGGQD